MASASITIHANYPALQTVSEHIEKWQPDLVIVNGDTVNLLADEPTGNLDTATGNVIADLLFELNHAEGTTLILVTHDERLAARCARQLRLDGGRLVGRA